MEILDKSGLAYVIGKIKGLLSEKVDKVNGKDLSSNDYTNDEKTKLSGIATGATRITTTDLLNFVYPVGSIYMSVSAVSPQTFIGGTWQRIQDTFLLAAGSNHAAGDTGGEETVSLNLAQMPSHNHNNKSLSGTISVTNMSVRYNGANATLLGASGIVNLDSTGTGGEKYYSSSTKISSFTGRDRVTVNASHTHDSQGSGQAHNNMPPYLCVYVWKRTA